MENSFINMGIFSEGEQADAYKKKKNNLQEKEKFNDIVNADRRANRTSDSATYRKHIEAESKKKGEQLSPEERRKIRDSHLTDDEWDKNKPNSGSGNKSVRDEIWRRYNNGNPMSAHQANLAKDAANRHARRHPKQYKECGIFEEANFINK